ncbi:MAG: VTT domain-containing protein [Caldilineaceae bacterium]
MSPEQPIVEETLYPASNPARALTLTERQQRWLGVGVVVLICLVSFWLAVNPAWVRWMGQWGYVGAFIVSLIASATVILPAPGIAVVIAMSPALNPIVLGIVAGVGSAFGELTGYAAGASGRAFIPPERKAQFQQVQRLTRNYGALILALLAALPFPLFDFAGIVAGALRMRILTFIIAVAIGKSIKYVILIVLGATSLQLLQQFFS